MIARGANRHQRLTQPCVAGSSGEKWWSGIACDRVLKAEEKWLRWRLTGFELRRNEGVGGGAQEIFRVGDGQDEASVDAWRADDEISTRVPAP
ncbi:hypothetical protein DY000_02044578 [Brassica cretica]|uniref:Uncharacterized protein n=1 Tax=Brassica cretica TaxID=69181 RepID=A0ABQ7F2C2_BRACR|nr:hypothetical protein DY000_02044578 [Brassica cretica]